MTTPPDDLVHTLRRHGQDHVLVGWDTLSDDDRTELVAQLKRLDFELLDTLYAKKSEPEAVPPPEAIKPLPVEAAADIPKSAVERGEAALRAGEVAVLLVAGGQGSRLGFDKPKGMFAVGPVSGASLFRVHAEKVLALSRRYGKPVPFLVMTSPATHADTEAYFAENGRFGLAADQITYFQQGTMPALDMATGKLLLEKPGTLFLSPNGHGGTLTALADSGLLADLKARGVRHVFYFQVDNPLVNIADPAYIGRHIEENADVSSKVVFKEQPEEKVGVLAEIHGRCGIVEYSDMPAAMAAERDAAGTLVYRAGNPAIHVFSVSFLERVTGGADRLAYHVAKKKVACWDPGTNTQVTPTTENALKFEMFVFDALPLADRYVTISVAREDEFAPVKNATGTDSPESSRQLQINRAGRWLTMVGVTVPTDAEGNVTVPVEISPLYALDVYGLVGRLPKGYTLTGPTFLE